MHIHILGICGTFMAGVASIARQSGHKVTGCDANVYPPMSLQLEAQSIRIIDGYDSTQLKLAPDLFIIGNVASRGNQLVEAILDHDYPYTSGPAWLRENILFGKWVLAVAGTHGKTTTSAMLAWILEDCGFNPSFLIGGVLNNFASSARLLDRKNKSNGPENLNDFFVIEADEYDTAFFDKGSKFLHYHPRTLILNNLEYDHADIFPNLSAIETQFHYLLRTLPAKTKILVNKNCENIARVLKRGCWSQLEYFNETTHATHDKENKSNYIGKHQELNTLAAISAAKHVGISRERSIQALKSFIGVKRRMELLGSFNDISVYDDFAHHPTAIATTLAHAANTCAGRIFAVFEPRSNTMKSGVMQNELLNSFEFATKIFAYQNCTGSCMDLTRVLAPLVDKSLVFIKIDELILEVARQARPKDWIIIMSNGDFSGAAQKILQAIQHG